MGQGKPWREHSEDSKWTEEFSTKLKHEVVELQSGCDLTLLVFGPSGHGKSSLINSLSTISLNRQSNLANSGQCGGHMTSVFRKYRLAGSLSSLSIGDTKGIVLKKKEGNKNLVQNVGSIIEGHIRPNMEFTTDEFPKSGESYIDTPKEKDKVHCLVLVINIKVFTNGDLYDPFREEVDNLLTILNGVDVPRIVVLTHADVIDEDVKADISCMFYREKIKNAVQSASALLGIPIENIFPIVNYSSTKYSCTKPLLHIPILLALRTAIYFAKDTIHKRQF